MTDFYLLFTKTRTMDRNLQYIKKVCVEIPKSTCLQKKTHYTLETTIVCKENQISTEIFEYTNCIQRTSNLTMGT